MIQEFLSKARQAALSAQILLDSGDAEGACDRAYYAMFNAARAALLATQAPVPPEIARTHSGLISAFSQYLVKTGLVHVELGKSLNKVEDLRLIADYKEERIDNEVAAWAVAQAKDFVVVMEQFCCSQPSL